MSVKKAILCFLLVSLCVSGVILYWSIDSSSWEIFKNADRGRIAIACVMVVLTWMLDALKVKFLTMAADERISFLFSFELTMINYFGSALTPMQSGGGPFQMYMMYQNGIGFGKSAAITLVRTIMTVAILGATIPISVVLGIHLPKMGIDMNVFIEYMLVVILLVWTVIALSLLRPKLLKRWVYALLMKIERLGFLSKSRAKQAVKRFVNEADSYNTIMRELITNGRKHFLLGIITAIAQMWVYLSIMPCLIWALNMPFNYVDCVVVEAIFIFMLYFVPSPGGSGAAEYGAAMVFRLFVPWSAAGMLGVGWRFLSEYTGIAVGIVVAMKVIGWQLTNKLFKSGDKGNVPCEDKKI
ncbi:membrane protein [Synergistales bacterium]|nr:membrane protein [Synergistales bacterium]